MDWVGAAAVDDDDVYAGTAGVLLGCAEVVTHGFDPGPAATAARDRLLQLAGPDGDAAALPDDGLFTGWAGVAVSLRAWAGATGDGAGDQAAAAVTARIAQRVLERPPDPTRCHDVIEGDAGILLALVPDETSRAADAVAELADRLVLAAEQTADGPQWRMTRDWDYLMPGFSHGTAGVAYALAAAGRRLDRPDLVDVAVRGADTLLALGQQAGGWALPLAIPPRPTGPPVNFGWCHGPAGTARLFLLLDQVAPQPRWQEAVGACLRALRDSRIPARLHPGYWDNVARCCGTAGVGQFLLDCYAATGDVATLDWAGTLAADVVSRAHRTTSGITWSSTEHTVTPPELPPEPGFMQGTAGIAGWLARLHAACTGVDARSALLGLDPPWV